MLTALGRLAAGAAAYLGWEHYPRVQRPHVTRDFGGEDTSHITPEAVRLALHPRRGDASLAAVREVVYEMAVRVYSDPWRPDNMTCYAQEVDVYEIMVRAGGKWALRPPLGILQEMGRRVVRILVERLPEGCEEEYMEITRALEAYGEKGLGLAANAAETEYLRPVLVKNGRHFGVIV